MRVEDLTEYEILHGSFGLIFVIISLIIGLKLILKYYSLRRKELITIGFSYIFLTSGWWGVSFSFLSIIIFNYAFEPVLYMFLQNAFIPLALLCWIYSFCYLVYPNLKKPILLIFLTICVIYEIFLFIFLSINPNLIATHEAIFYSRRTLFSLSFVIFAIVSALITGILFAKRSQKSEDPKIKWKGKFLLIAFISFSIGSFLDASIPQIPVFLVIVRLLLISSAIEYYLGFFLPDRLSDWLTKRSS